MCQPLIVSTEEYNRYLRCYGEALRQRREGQNMAVIGNSVATYGEALIDHRAMLEQAKMTQGFSQTWQEGNTCFACTPNGMTWTSRDGGQSWQHAIYDQPPPASATTIAISKFTGRAWDAIKGRLFSDDPSWEDYKSRWATEFGPIGDETP